MNLNLSFKKGMKAYFNASLSGIKGANAAESFMMAINELKRRYLSARVQRYFFFVEPDRSKKKKKRERDEKRYGESKALPFRRHARAHHIWR